MIEIMLNDSHVLLNHFSIRFLITSVLQLNTNQNGLHKKNLQTINAGEDVEKMELSYILCGNIDWYSPCVEQDRSSLRN